MLMFLLVILGSSCRTYPLATPLSFTSFHCSPVFIIPACDYRNPIERVYLKEHIEGINSILEVTVVFKDEDQPFFFFDAVYDLYRRFRFHRKKDIETFYIQMGDAGKRVESIDFGDAYSKDQRFHKGFVTHYHEVVSGDRIEMKGERPVVYINTWNHLFSEKDTNPSLNKTFYTEYAIFDGNRTSAEPR